MPAHGVAPRGAGHATAVASGGTSYGAALQVTLRNTAAAYGYTLAIASTVGVLTTVRGKPREGELFLLAGGALTAFVALELVTLLAGRRLDDGPDDAFPLAGALNFLGVFAALGASVGMAHAVASSFAWFLAGFAATAVYLLFVALQVTCVARIRRR